MDQIRGIVPTALPAGELEALGLNTVANDLWRNEISDAAYRNGGFGDAASGFLAWSKQGFVRLANPYLSAEQNMRLAKISLQIGIPIERLPSRRDKKVGNDLGQWLNGFLNDAEGQIAAFLSGQSDRVELKDGKRRYGVLLENAFGTSRNYYYKKRSGLKKFGRNLLREWGELAKSTSGRRLSGSLASRSSLLENILPPEQLRLADPFYLGGSAAERYGKGEISLREFVANYASNYARVASMLPAPTPLAAALRYLQVYGAQLAAKAAQPE